MSLFEQAFAALGDTADTVAIRLENRGYTGMRRHPSCCPIAKYVNDLPFVAKWKCGEGVAMTCPRPGVVTWHDSQTLDPQVPEAVKDFMCRFDDGDYPSLDSHRNGYTA